MGKKDSGGGTPATVALTRAGIAFTLDSGQALILRGPNGSGTTSLRGPRVAIFVASSGGILRFSVLTTVDGPSCRKSIA